MCVGADGGSVSLLSHSSSFFKFLEHQCKSLFAAVSPLARETKAEINKS